MRRLELTVETRELPDDINEDLNSVREFGGNIVIKRAYKVCLEINAPSHPSGPVRVVVNQETAYQFERYELLVLATWLQAQLDPSPDNPYLAKPQQ